MIAPWENIDRARREKGYSLKELAERVGVSESAVQYWKNGKTISLDTIAKLALVLDTTVDALLRPASNGYHTHSGEWVAVEAVLSVMDDTVLQGTFQNAVEQSNDVAIRTIAHEIAERAKRKRTQLNPEGKSI